MATHQILLRGASQCHLLHAAMNLVDVVSASPLRVCPSFRAGGCAEVDEAGLEPRLFHGRPLADTGNAYLERTPSPTNESGSLPAVLPQTTWPVLTAPSARLECGQWSAQCLVSGTRGSREPPREEFACRWELRCPGAPLAEDAQALSLSPLLPTRLPGNRCQGCVLSSVCFLRSPHNTVVVTGDQYVFKALRVIRSLAQPSKAAIDSW